MILNYKSLEEKGMSEVIVITSGKGGVGKTTSTANIGTGLAKLGKGVDGVEAVAGGRVPGVGLDEAPLLVMEDNAPSDAQRLGNFTNREQVFRAIHKISPESKKVLVSYIGVRCTMLSYRKWAKMQEGSRDAASRRARDELGPFQRNCSGQRRPAAVERLLHPRPDRHVPLLPPIFPQRQNVPCSWKIYWRNLYGASRGMAARNIVSVLR